MSSDHLDDLLRDHQVNDARRDKQLADERRRCEALARQDAAYESLRNCARDRLDRELAIQAEAAGKKAKPSTLDEYLAQFAQRVVKLHAVLTDNARARLQGLLSNLDGDERIACELLLSGDADDVLARLRKIAASPSMLKAMTDWLRFEIEDILADVDGPAVVADVDLDADDLASNSPAPDAEAELPTAAHPDDVETKGSKIRLKGSWYRLTDKLVSLLTYLLRNNGATEDTVCRHFGFNGGKHLQKRLTDLRGCLERETKKLRATEELHIKTDDHCITWSWHPRRASDGTTKSPTN